MNVNIRLESSSFCYVYSKYRIETFNKKVYILPEKNATKKTISITENIDDILVDTLNLGKKQYFEENITNDELLEYFSKYGLFGFMIDLAINKYFVLDEKVAVRDPFYINFKENINLMNTTEYLKFFFPELNKKEINQIIKKCKDYVNETTKENYITSTINEYLIYSEYYAEPLEMILNYARSLYKSLALAVENKFLNMQLPFLSINHLSHNFHDFYYKNNFAFTMNYLKQSVDTYYAMQMGQDTRLLKLCNFCDNAFIAKNPKAEYDTYNCKNKANVYKSRKRVVSKNVILTDDGIKVKITPSKESSDT